MSRSLTTQKLTSFNPVHTKYTSTPKLNFKFQVYYHLITHITTRIKKQQLDDLVEQVWLVGTESWSILSRLAHGLSWKWELDVGVLK